jgi:hypothetical protein
MEGRFLAIQGACTFARREARFMEKLTGKDLSFLLKKGQRAYWVDADSF